MTQSNETNDDASRSSLHGGELTFHQKVDKQVVDLEKEREVCNKSMMFHSSLDT